MRILVICIAVLCCAQAQAVERKRVTDVDVNALTNETQVMEGGNNSIDLIWWIPTEFWEATMRQNPDVPTEQVDQIIGVLRNHSVLAVVQADISQFGAFSFYGKDQVMDGLKVEIRRGGSKVETISHTEPADPDLRILLDQMRPVLANAMGNLGQNFYFFPLPDIGRSGDRIASPYDKGTLKVTLQRGDSTSTLEIDLPLDSLFVPRICPNGRPAHVSWKYCPWNGEKLP